MNAPGNNYLQMMQNTSLLSGGNNVFVEGLYEDYLQDASSVPAEWRAYFDKLQTANSGHDVAHSPIQRSFLNLRKQPGGGAGTCRRDAQTGFGAATHQCLSFPRRAYRRT